MSLLCGVELWGVVGVTQMNSWWKVEDNPWLSKLLPSQLYHGQFGNNILTLS